MILFVGDKPSPKMKPEARAFEGAACEKRLFEWIAYLLDISELEVVLGTNSRWGWTNTARPNDDLFADSYYVLNSTHDYFSLIASPYNCYLSKAIALGNNASDALSTLGTPHFKLPHPSGRNRQINNKDFIAKKLEECKLWLKEQQK